MQEQNMVVGGEYPDVGARISKALSLYGAYFVPFFLISLATLPLNILSSIWELGVIFAIPGAIVTAIVDAALILAVAQALTGNVPQPGNHLSEAWSRFGRLFELGLRTLGAVLGLAITIVGIPWAIRVGVRWFLGTQAIMLQDMDAKAAISESCRLVEGDWWRTFGNLLLLGLLIGIPGGIAVGFSFAVSTVVGGILSAIVTTITTPFWVIAVTLYYLRLKQEKGVPPSPMPAVDPSPPRPEAAW